MNFIDTTVDSAAEYNAPRAERPSDAQVVIRVFAGLRSVWMLSNEALNQIAGLPASPAFDPMAVLDMGPGERARVLNRMLGALDVASCVRDRFGSGQELSWVHQRNGSPVLKNRRPYEALYEEGGASLLLKLLSNDDSEEKEPVSDVRSDAAPGTEPVSGA